MMLIKSIEVSIRWLKSDEGGRHSLLTCRQYFPTITFSKEDAAIHWSFPIIFESLPDYDCPTIAEGSFLADNSAAPWNKMILGTEFYVREGKRITGIGTVLEEARYIMLDI